MSEKSLLAPGVYFLVCILATGPRGELTQMFRSYTTVFHPQKQTKEGSTAATVKGHLGSSNHSITAATLLTTGEFPSWQR